MLGPLFRYELTRLARRGLQPKLRAAFAGVLLVVLFLSYLAAFPGVRPTQLVTRIDEPLTTEAASRFGERFLVLFLFAQAAVVALVTPAVAAGAVGEDKSSGSLNLLLVTSLTNREIVVGKYAARVAFVGSLLLTGLPVVTLVTFMGGLDTDALLCGYAVVFLTMCSHGAFAVAMSVLYEPRAGGLLRTYLGCLAITVFGLACACFRLPALVSPLGATWVVLSGWPHPAGNASPAAERLWLVAAVAAVNLTAAAGLLAVASSALREPSTPAEPHRPPEPDSPRVVIRLGPEVRTWTVPEVDDADPLVWKERHFGGANPVGGNPEVFVLAVAAGTLGFIILVMAMVVGGTLAFAALACAAGLVAIAGAGVRAAGAVVGERQRQTLESLRALPIDPGEILRAKARGAIHFGLYPGLVAWGVVLLGVIRTSLAFPAAVALPLTLAGWVAGVVGAGLWLSVRCETRQRAATWLLTAVAAVCVVPHLIGGAYWLTPALGLWAAVAPDWDWDSQPEWGEMVQSVVAAAVVAVAGLVCLKLATRRFVREGG